MKKVATFAMPPSGDHYVDLPEGAEILGVELRNGQIEISTVFAVPSGSFGRRFWIASRSSVLPDEPMEFIGTARGDPSGPLYVFAGV